MDNRIDRMDHLYEFGFGKKENNTYRIIEREFKNGKIKYYIEVTEKYDDRYLQPDHVYIYNGIYNSFEKAKDMVLDMIEKDKEFTCIREDVHNIIDL